MRLLRTLRFVSVSMLVLLALQFELGMALNLSPDMQEVAPLGPSVSAVWAALAAVGGAAITHAVLGSALTIVALAELVLALSTRVTGVAIIGGFSFVTVVLAAVMGRNDGYSHGMATNFLLTFTMHFVQVCVVSVKVRAPAAF